MNEVEPRPDAIYQTSRAVGDAWSWLLMREALLHGVRRFADFQSRLSIARSTLSARLRQLVDGGLLERGPEGSKTAEDYLPTPAGEDFFDCLMTAMTWGDQWYTRRQTRPLLVTHVPCGGEASPQLCCTTCRKILVAQDVRPQHPERRLGVSRLPGHTHRAPGYELLERLRPCSIARTQTVLGDWWSCLVVREAFFDVHRFDEFRSNLDVATNILTARLTRLVEHGVLRRTPYQTRPVRHEYHLTDKGLDLYPVALAIISWGDRWKSPTGPLVPLAHLPCGQPLHAQLSCGSCGADLLRRDVDIAYPVPEV